LAPACSPPCHHDVRARPRCLRTLRAVRRTTPRSRRNTHMLRSFARRGGILLAALALPVLLLGNAATATTPSQAKLASATLNGDGSTFQLGFNQVCIGAFKQQQKAVTLTYQG